MARLVTDDKEENKPNAVWLLKCEFKMTLSQLQEDIKWFVVRSVSVQKFKLLIRIQKALRQKTAMERTSRRGWRIILKLKLKM